MTQSKVHCDIIIHLLRNPSRKKICWCGQKISRSDAAEAGIMSSYHAFETYQKRVDYAIVLHPEGFLSNDVSESSLLLMITVETDAPRNIDHKIVASLFLCFSIVSDGGIYEKQFVRVEADTLHQEDSP
jgi:hypothetical protein